MTQQVWLRPDNPKAFKRALVWGAEWHAEHKLFTLAADHRMVPDAQYYGLRLVEAPAPKPSIYDNYDGTDVLGDER